MSRDKQIEEMAKLIGEADQRCYEIEDCDDCPFHHIELGLCKERFVADALYNAGYRKASEFAEEIFAEIETSLMVSGCRGGSFFYEIRVEDYNHYKKKYTKSEVAERCEDIENSPADCSTPGVTDQKGEGK